MRNERTFERPFLQVKQEKRERSRKAETNGGCVGCSECREGYLGDLCLGGVDESHVEWNEGERKRWET